MFVDVTRMQLKGNRRQRRSANSARLEGPELIDGNLDFRQRKRTDSARRLHQYGHRRDQFLDPQRTHLPAGAIGDRLLLPAESFEQDNTPAFPDGLGKGKIAVDGFRLVEFEIEDDDGGVPFRQPVDQLRVYGP